VNVSFVNPEAVICVINTYAEMGVDTLYMKISKNSVLMSAIDASHTSTMTVKADARSDGESEIGFPVFSWRKVKGKIKYIDRMSVDDSGILLSVGSISYRLPMSAEEYDKEIWTPKSKIDYKYVDVTMSEFIRNYDGISILKMPIVFEYDNGILKMHSSTGEGVSASSDILTSFFKSKDEKEEHMKTIISYELIDTFKSLIKMSDTVKIGIGNNVPIYIEPVIEGMDIKIYIAPRVEQ